MCVLTSVLCWLSWCTPRSDPWKAEGDELRSKSARLLQVLAPERTEVEAHSRACEQLGIDLARELSRRVEIYKKVHGLRGTIKVAEMLSRRARTGHTAVSWAAAVGEADILGLLLDKGGAPAHQDAVQQAAAKAIQVAYKQHLFDLKRPPWTRPTAHIRRVEDLANDYYLRWNINRMLHLLGNTRLPMIEAIYNGHFDVRVCG